MRRHGHDRVLDRIGALLRKARHAEAGSSREMQAEAEAAMAHAVSLMRKHGIEESMVDVDRDSGAVGIDASSVGEAECFTRARLERWDRWLGGLAARIAGCRSYWIRRWQERGNGRSGWAMTVCLYGLPEDVAVAKALFVWLRDTMHRSTTRFLKELYGVRAVDSGLRNGLQARSYRDGWIHGVHLAVGRQEREEDASDDQVPVTDRTGNALMVLGTEVAKAKADALDRYARGLGLQESRSSTVTRDLHSYRRGREEGASLRVSRNQIHGR